MICAKFEVNRSSSLSTVLERAPTMYDYRKSHLKFFWVFFVHFINVPTTIQFISIVTIIRLNNVVTMKTLVNNAKKKKHVLSDKFEVEPMFQRFIVACAM